MFTINKLADPEWYYRKMIVLLKPFLSENTLSELDLKHRIKRNYEYVFGRKLHLVIPRTLNEKLIWLSYYWRHPLKTECADKLRVRDYVVGRCGLPEDLLVPIIGIYTNPDLIDFSALPDRYVLKCNHGCGYNVIVADKFKDENVALIKSQLAEWLSHPYGGGISELHYYDISPRVIICEQFLPSIRGQWQVDYKVFCFNGKPSFIQICFDRDGEQKAKHATFDFEWNQLYYTKDEKQSDICAPASLKRMADYAEKLSADFPFVRVDFYDIEGRPMLSELTFTPYGNMLDWYKDDVMVKFGKMLKLPHKYR